MRPETNNEMDLLLRRLGRRQETSASPDHLDADELSSYAENALPPAARARYTEHLAECAGCRDLVVQLSSSAGAVVALETTKVSEPSTLRKVLASLFSPMVLRYAVPALGLVVVAAIGFIVSRNGGVGYSPVAEVRDHQPTQAPVPANQEQPSSSPAEESRGLLDSKTSTTKPDAKGNTASETVAAAPPPNAAPAVTTVTAEVQDTATKKVEQQQAESKEAAPAPKPTPATDELKKLEAEGRKQTTEVRAAVANEPPAEKAKTQDRSVASVASASPAAARRGESSGATTGRATARPMAQAERADEVDKDKNDAALRTVAGRRFRKQDNVWIDTAYSSQNVIRLTRGSEQYRALVADEPAIKQIADQLDGEIIVVWKGRAYRIQ